MEQKKTIEQLEQEIIMKQQEEQQKIEQLKQEILIKQLEQQRKMELLEEEIKMESTLWDNVSSVITHYRLI